MHKPWWRTPCCHSRIFPCIPSLNLCSQERKFFSRVEFHRLKRFIKIYSNDSYSELTAHSSMTFFLVSMLPSMWNLSKILHTSWSGGSIGDSMLPGLDLQITKMDDKKRKANQKSELFIIHTFINQTTRFEESNNQYTKLNKWTVRENFIYSWNTVSISMHNSMEVNKSWKWRKLFS